MNDTELLKMLKVDLGMTKKAYDARLVMLIEAAKREIEREGATLDLSEIDHANLVVMYAGWLWRRRDTGAGMPRMIRYALNNLVLSQKMGGETDG